MLARGHKTSASVRSLLLNRNVRPSSRRGIPPLSEFDVLSSELVRVIRVCIAEELEDPTGRPVSPVVASYFRNFERDFQSRDSSSPSIERRYEYPRVSHGFHVFHFDQRNQERNFIHTHRLLHYFLSSDLIHAHIFFPTRSNFGVPSSFFMTLLALELMSNV